MSTLDKQLGIEVYASKSLGIGGVIREAVDDFVVEEVLVDGSKASLSGTVAGRVLGSTLQKQGFLLSVLVKRNWDTLIAIRNVSKQLGIDQRRIQIAGIKDARAITAQHLTIEDASIEDVSKVNVKDIQLYPIGYLREALSLYYLLGNIFTIKIKAIKHKKSTVETRISQTFGKFEALGGIPNFFGHQRFGTTRPITHLVGKALINGRVEEAAMLFLAQPSVYEHPASRRARLDLQSTKNFKQALENFPKQLRFEMLMLNHLADKPDDFIGAFQRLPVKLQELFVQAYQSYLFNRFLSERVKHGYSLNKAEVGDFVVAVELSGLPLNSVTKNVTEETLFRVNERIKAGKLRVALPIVGIRQKLSQGVMGQIEKKVLEEEEIKLENLRINVLSRIGGKGGLRTTITPIRDFKLQNVSANVDGKDSQAELSFMLLRGSYATVVLREIMKPKSPVTAGF
ncbi:MAG TPA: tRNA pseudouridine(13) synthase TruD [Verrucomicrobiae bacterium]|nr:tRNA pseudouridine(13) synthase TruD [Verrucomicrobiae bacterium]